MRPIQGLHHITAVASDPQANVDFYVDVLGQRLVKTTVNFDDPGTYHLYYGDEVGTPGTALTFFPWRHMHRGRIGSGETSAMAYAVRPESLNWWRERLRAHDVTVFEPGKRFGEEVLQFEDPDGMTVEIVGTNDPSTIRHWQEGPIPEDHALRGFHSVTLLLERVEGTSEVLTDQLGYVLHGQEGDRYRYRGASDDRGLYIDLEIRPGTGRGTFGAGSIHHIAFRTVDDDEQIEYLHALRGAGLQVTPVQDRQYFHSIYFREPGGVLFEVATDAPGFTLDETVESLGTALKLPAWYERMRQQIEARLPAIERKTYSKS
ncbi:MAG: ring-cleaving dioxygenase [Bacteroidota bacterium]|nr:ring-cleaving dioxygenase [Bacteroidota bacterium]